MERTHPEWILANVPLMFDQFGVGHAHLEVDVAKNLKLKENIYAAVAGLIKNNVEGKTCFQDKTCISFVIACV